MNEFLRMIFLLPMIVLMFFVDLRDKPQRIFKDSGISIIEPTGKWDTAEKLPTQRYDFGGAVLENSFYIIGGIVLPSPWLPTARVDAYDSVAKRWNRIRDYPKVVHHPGVTVCEDQLYVVSGYWLRIMPSQSMYKYNKSSNDWIKLADIPVPRGALGVVCLSGKIYAIGGESGKKQLDRLDVYDIQKNSWESKASMPTAREHLAVVSANNKIFALGGLVGDRFHTLAANEMYDPKTDTWVKRAPLPHDIAGFSAAVLGDSIYIFGGHRGNAVSAEVFEYKVTEDTWIRRTNMPKARYGLVAGTMQGAAIHVVGGNEKVKGNFLSQDHSVFFP